MKLQILKSNIGWYILTYVLLFLLNIFLQVVYSGYPFNSHVIVFSFVMSLIIGSTINLIVFARALQKAK